MDRAAKRANEDSVLEHEHEYAKRRNGPGLSPDKAASVSISVFLPDNATRAHQVSHNLSDNRYGPTDRAPFIVHMQVSSDCITESAFEVLMKRQVAKVVHSDIVSMKKVSRGKISIEIRTYETANNLVTNLDLIKGTLFLFLLLR